MPAPSVSAAASPDDDADPATGTRGERPVRRSPAGGARDRADRGRPAGGQPEPDLCPLPAESESQQPARPTAQLLETLDFDARMRSARAVIVGVERLDERTLIASLTFEIATRARQSGVPAYALTVENHLNAFDARILDLQVILQAGSARALSAAGRKLAGLV